MIVITRPLPRSPSTPADKGERIVVMVTAAGIRMHRCTGDTTATLIAREWQFGMFESYPGQLRPAGG